MDDSHTTLVFPLLPRKPVHVEFTGEAISSDGGLVLLAQVDREIGLTQRVADVIWDPRLPERVTHQLVELIRQRTYQICAAYEDCNDADRLREDPILKVAVGRCPMSGEPLASQPTLSRLEHTVAEVDCEAVNAVLLEHFLRIPRKAPREVILDLDTTEDPTHGQQEFAFYNTHYGSRCFLPLFGFARVAGETEEFLVSAELPDGHDKNVEAILARVRRLVAGIRARWPGVRVVLRADSWFGTPEIYDGCEDERISYTIGLARNSVLERMAEPCRERAIRLAASQTDKSARCCASFQYQAGSWRRARRIIVKVDVTPQGVSQRFLVVAGMRGRPGQIYRFYSGRGESENRIKEMKQGVKIDRTSCVEFASNKVRLMLHAVAYVLLQRLRWYGRRTGLACTQVEGLRIRLIKIGALVKETQRRVHIIFSRACPSQASWTLLAHRAGVSVG